MHSVGTVKEELMKKAINRIHKRLCFFLINHILAGTGCWELKRLLLNSLGNSIGEGCKVVAPVICTGKLIVGANCWIGRDFCVNGNGTVTIGANCDIAPNVSFQTGGHLIGDESRRAGRGVKFDFHVGDGVWIGARATFLNGVTVGDGSVIAACACVANDTPPNTLCGGVPARVIKSLDGVVLKAEEATS